MANDEIIVIALLGVGALIWYNWDKKKLPPARVFFEDKLNQDVIDKLKPLIEQGKIKPEFLEEAKQRVAAAEKMRDMKGLEPAEHSETVITEHIPIQSTQAPNVPGNSKEPSKPEEIFSYVRRYGKRVVLGAF